MEVSFDWEGIPPVHIAIILSLAGFFVVSKFWARNRSRPKKEKEKVLATGYYLFIVAVFALAMDVASGLALVNPSWYLLVSVAATTLALVYVDGHLTEKAIGSRFAIEANPLMSWLFRSVGIGKVRIFIFVAMLVLLIGRVIRGDLVTIVLLCLLWVFVDSNNIMYWLEIRRRQALKASVANLEWGFEDIHEL